MSANNPKKILIVLHGAIGDVTRALALAVRIKRSWPETEVVWAVEPKSKRVIENHPAVDKVIVFDRPRGFFAYVSFVRVLRAGKPDVVLDLQRHFKSGITSYLSGGKRRIGFHRKNAKEFNWLFNTESIPAVENFSAKIEHYQKFGDLLGLARMERLEFDLNSSVDAKRRIDDELSRSPAKRFIAFILGSSWPSRVWPAEYYISLAERLWKERQIAVVLVGGESEKRMAAEIEQRVSEVPVINTVAQTTLDELPALFKRMQVAIGSDSGPMHIAAAVGIPVVSLWGSTSPRRSAPYGSEQLVLQTAVACSPCYRRECPGLNTICMTSIPPAAVMAGIEKAVGFVQNTRVD